MDAIEKSNIGSLREERGLYPWQRAVVELILQHPEPFSGKTALVEFLIENETLFYDPEAMRAAMDAYIPPYLRKV